VDEFFWKRSCGTVSLSPCICSLTSPDNQVGTKERAWTINPSRKQEKNESESYGVAAYIEILSFLWDVPCWWVRILVSGIFFGDTLFNFSDFDWEVCHGVGSTYNPGFNSTIACWQSRLEIVYPVCFLS